MCFQLWCQNGPLLVERSLKQWQGGLQQHLLLPPLRPCRRQPSQDAVVFCGGGGAVHKELLHALTPSLSEQFDMIVIPEGNQDTLQVRQVRWTFASSWFETWTELLIRISVYAEPWGRAQRDSIRSQTFHSKWTAYDITKYETFHTKYGIVCSFKRTFVNSRGTAYHILLYPLFWKEYTP